jgi:hypothetical protein
MEVKCIVRRYACKENIYEIKFIQAIAFFRTNAELLAALSYLQAISVVQHRTTR